MAFPAGNGSDCRKTFGKLERLETLSSQTVEKPLESSRGPELSRAFNRARRRVRRARDDFCGGKSHFPEQKSFPCSFCARKAERFFAKTGRGGSGGGACSPVHQLVKNFFDKLNSRVSKPSRVFNRTQQRVGLGMTIFAVENPIPRAKTGEGCTRRGALIPACQLVKAYFDKPIIPGKQWPTPVFYRRFGISLSPSAASDQSQDTLIPFRDERA